LLAVNVGPQNRGPIRTIRDLFEMFRLLGIHEICSFIGTPDDQAAFITIEKVVLSS
jgi:hypothetical protein